MNEAQVVANATRWAGELPAMSDAFEKARRLPSEVAQSFRDDGFFRLLVPRANGGLEAHPLTVVEVIKQIARGDGSAGWNVMIGATTGLLAASLPVEHAKTIYGEDEHCNTLTVGVTAPLGKAVKVDGGYRVTGRWPFGSGSQNADWICGGSFIFEDGVQLKNEQGAPDIHLMMFPAADVVIEDTWHVAGLKGTGSHHFHVEDVFVPDGRSVVLGGRTRVKQPVYQFPMLGLLALGVSSVSLGIGYAAVDEFTRLATEKTPTGSKRSLAERPMVQMDVARSVADLRSAEAFMKEVINEAWQHAAAGERLDVTQKANLRLAAANTTHKAVAAVDRLYEAAGGSSIYENSPLQRCFRDIHVTTQHIMVANPIFEVTGRVQLGLPAGSPL